MTSVTEHSTPHSTTFTITENGQNSQGNDYKVFAIRVIDVNTRYLPPLVFTVWWGLHPEGSSDIKPSGRDAFAEERTFHNAPSSSRGRIFV